MTTTTTLQVKSIDHVTFIVKDLEASRQFYVDLLGMTLVPRPNFDFQGLWFQAGSTLIHLILQHDKSGPAGILKPPHLTSSRTHHLAFLVEDCPAAFQTIQRLIDSGHSIQIVHPLKRRPDGAHQLFLADPDGHIIELTSGP